MKYLIIIFMLFLFFISNKSLAQEISVPLDEESKLDVITDTIANEIQIFNEYPNFKEARLLKINDTSFILEVSMSVEGKLQRIRNSMNKFQADSLRKFVKKRIDESINYVKIDQSGRGVLLAGTTIEALSLWGFSVPYIILGEPRSNNLSKFLGLYLISAGAGFFIPFYLTNNAPCSEASGTLSFMGGLTGIHHGLMASLILSGKNKDTKTLLTILTGSSIIETYIGYSWAKNTAMSPGHADMISLCNIIGTGYVFGVAYATGLLDDPSNGKIGFCGLLGSLAGIFAGNEIAKNYDYTHGDVGVMTTTGFIGGYLPVIYPAIAGSDADPKVYVGLVVASSLAGFIVGNNLIKDRHFTTNQGIFMSLGAVGGGLVGLGCGAMVGGVVGGTLLAGAGSILGFSIIYNHFAKNPESKDKKEDKANLDINFNPIGLANSLSNKQIYNSQTIPQIHVPVLELKYRF